MAVAEQEKQFIIMKKSIFIIAALLAATFVNAQITLEHTFEGTLRVPHEIIDVNNRTLGDIYAYEDNGTLVCIDPLTYNESARIAIPDMKYYDMMAKNIYSTDGLIGFITSDVSGHAYVYNQNGIMLADLGVCFYICLIKISSGYKLVVYRENDESRRTTSIYSLPGNGEAQAVSTPSSPKRSARKIVREGQVLVQTDNNTYTLTGAEVK